MSITVLKDKLAERHRLAKQRSLSRPLLTPRRRSRGRS